MGESANVLVRVWLPDRPGALGLVASRIGAVRGDIVGIDVLERDQGVVIDEFAVRLADLDLISVLVKEVEEVDGASVEEVRIVGRFPDPRLDALESAATLCEAPSTAALGERLVAQISRSSSPSGACCCAATELLAAAGEAPDADQLHALATGTMASPVGRRGRERPGRPRGRDPRAARRDAARRPRGPDVPAPRAGPAVRAGPRRRPGLDAPRAASSRGRGRDPLESRR